MRTDEGVPILKWYMDASFSVHEDFRSHTGGDLKPSEGDGALISGSMRQKLNTRSSTEAELVGADDFVSKIVWTSSLFFNARAPPRAKHLIPG